MTRSERRAKRNRVAITSCAGCNHLHLEILHIEGPSVLCNYCGWWTPALKGYDDD
jgi:hypothetical protein